MAKYKVSFKYADILAEEIEIENENILFSMSQSIEDSIQSSSFINSFNLYEYNLNDLDSENDPNSLNYIYSFLSSKYSTSPDIEVSFSLWNKYTETWGVLIKDKKIKSLQLMSNTADKMQDLPGGFLNLSNADSTSLFFRTLVLRWV